MEPKSVHPAALEVRHTRCIVSMDLKRVEEETSIRSACVTNDTLWQPPDQHTPRGPSPARRARWKMSREDDICDAAHQHHKVLAARVLTSKTVHASCSSVSRIAVSCLSLLLVSPLCSRGEHLQHKFGLASVSLPRPPRRISRLLPWRPSFIIRSDVLFVRLLAVCRGTWECDHALQQLSKAGWYVAECCCGARAASFSFADLRCSLPCLRVAWSSRHASL